jgi:ABC-type bacteriocin/lantibiotic exporter with double-glycine peptidase domain
VDCGPRALLLVCQRLGVRTDLQALTKAAGTGPKGTSLAGLKRAAEALHLTTEGVQTSREALPDLPMPAIAWEPGNGGHYVAVLSLSGRGESGTATIHDPNEPSEKTVSQEQLLQACGGYLMTLRR